MGRFIEGCERRQALLLADCVDDYVGAENPVRVIDVFVDELDLAAIGFEGAAATGRPGNHPATLLKLYLYGYMNQVQSSRRLEREAELASAQVAGPFVDERHLGPSQAVGAICSRVQAGEADPIIGEPGCTAAP